MDLDRKTATGGGVRAAILFAAFAITIGALGFWSFNHQFDTILDNRRNELRAVAQLKIGEITAWRAERLGDISIATSGPSRQALLRVLRGDKGTIRETLEYWRGLCDVYKYDNVLLFSVDGRLRLSLERAELSEQHPGVQDHVRRVAAEKKAIFGDFFPCSSSDRIHLDLAAPVLDDDGSSAGVFVLRSNPQAYLFPLIQSWPTPSETAETLLVRRDGQNAVFLNTLRHSQSPPLALRIPLSDMNIPAVRVISEGRPVSMQGLDYRGVEVLAETRPVPDTPWFMVAKVDMAEVAAQARSSRVFVSIVTSLGIACGALLLLTLMQHRERRTLQSLYKSERLLTQSRTLLAASSDGAFVVEPATGRLLDINDTACRLLGFDRETLLARSLGDLDSGLRDGWEEMVQTVREKGRPPFETNFGKSDGASLQVEVGMRYVTSEHGDYIVATARDIAGRKRQERIERQRMVRAQALVRLFEQADGPVRDIIATAVEALVEVTESRLGFLGFVSADETLLTTHLWSEQAMNSCAIDSKPVEFSIPTGGLWTASIREKRPVTVNDYGRPHPLKRGCPHGHVELTRFLSVPLIRNGRAVLVAGLANKTEDYTAQDEIETVLFLEGIWGVLTRKQAEESLMVSEERWRRTVEMAPFPIIVHAEDGEVLSVNRAWTNLSGYALADIPTIQDWTLAAYGFEAQDVRAIIDELYKSPEPTREGEFAIRTADGQTRVWDFESAPLRRMEDGRRTVISMAHDITDLKDALTRLEHSHENLENLLNNLDAVVYVADMETNELLFMNAFGSESLGKRSPDMKCYEAIVEGQVRPCPFCTNHLLLDAEGKPAGIHRWEFQNSRTKRWYDCRDQAIRWWDGRLVRLEIAFDITMRKEHEEELKSLAEELLRSNRELEQFAYVASHDLQEPLRMVSSYTQLLAARYGDRLDQDAREFIDYAVDGANRMQRLIQDLLAFSRVTTRGGLLEDVDTHMVLAEALKNLHASIREAGAVVSTGELPVVTGDHQQLVMLFQNLVSNALKFRDPGRRTNIRIEAAQTPGQEGFCTFTVSDNGIGIEEKFFDRIFVIFQRLHGRQEYPGTGIGLALCKRVVERHGGRIWLESTFGTGTTFFFTLPIPKKPKEIFHEKHEV